MELPPVSQWVGVCLAQLYETVIFTFLGLGYVSKCILAFNRKNDMQVKEKSAFKLSCMCIITNQCILCF